MPIFPGDNLTTKKGYQESVSIALGHMSASNAETGRDYLDTKVNGGGATSTLLTIVRPLRALDNALGGKDFGEVTMKELSRFLAAQDLKPSTRRLYASIIKTFYTTMLPDHFSDKELKTFKPGRGAAHDFQESDLLTDAEVARMIERADDYRMKAAIAVFSETGLRASELLSLTRGCIVKYPTHWDLTLPDVEGLKTGRRTVAITTSVKHLERWLRELPDRPETPLWPAVEHGMDLTKNISYGSLKAQIKLIARKAGIARRVWLHGFRHAAALRMARQGYSAYELMAYFGWSEIETSLVYVKLASKDVTNSKLRKEGIVKDDAQKAIVQAKTDEELETEATFRQVLQLLQSPGSSGKMARLLVKAIQSADSVTEEEADEGAGA